MSTPPLLVTRYRNGSAQVGRLLGGTTFAQLGNDLPAGVEGTTSTTSMTNCRAVQFKNKVYAYQKDRIYRFDEGTTNDWVEVHQAVSQDTTAGSGFHSGIHVLQINNIPTMVAFYRNTPNFDLQALHSTDGITWTLFDTNTSTGTNLVGRSFVFRNEVYIWFNSATIPGLLKYDPIAKVATVLTSDGGWVIGFSKDFCVFNGELYGIGPTNIGNDQPFELKKLVGSQFTTVQTLSSAHKTFAGGYADSSIVLFSDGVNMYAFIPGKDVSSSDGTTAVQLAPNGATFTETDISASVLPTSVRPPSGGVHFWHCFLDNDTDPENPDITIWSQVPNGTSAYNAWQWNGPNSLITDIGPGPNAGLALPHTKDGGGEYVWTPGEPNIEITDISPNIDSQTISFIAYSTEATGIFKARFWYGVGEGFAKTAATLIGPVNGGGVLSTDTIGDFVDDIVADGVTVHTVIWDVVTDGFVKGASTILMPTISL
jgi:hypothetical protein